VKLLLDTGPWVALMCRDDRYHDWARQQFASHPGPLLTCEAVVAETCFLLSRGGFDPGKALRLVERGVVQVAMSLQAEIASVRACSSATTTCPPHWPTPALSAWLNCTSRRGC
jgi:predicted nucleic acid-binding protein